MGTKGSGTVRPFARVPSHDLLLYQALLDAVALDLEAAIGPRNRVFGYRLAPPDADDPFFDTPNWEDFISSVRGALKSGRYSHALTGDITSYFVYVDIDELERSLLAVCTNPDAARDLGALLRGWQQLGIRGLPQGLPPSSPLGNFYLAGLDAILEQESASYRRYMDDFWVFTKSFSDARRMQDVVERYLYRLRLGLGGDKSRILRSKTAIAATATAQERIDARRAAIAEDLLAAGREEYAELDEAELPEQEIDAAAVHAEYDELLDELSEDRYPQEARQRSTQVYRELEKGRDPHALDDVPDILERLPSVTWPAAKYVASMPATESESVERVLLAALGTTRFHRDQEWLHFCRSALLLKGIPMPRLAKRFAKVALEHEHPLVRARALLSWGRLSEAGDFQTADRFWKIATAPWKPYVVVALQSKRTFDRDERYAKWSADGRFLRSLTKSIQKERFAWRTL
jgi:hypothetical protein